MTRHLTGDPYEQDTEVKTEWEAEFDQRFTFNDLGIRTLYTNRDQTKSIKDFICDLLAKKESEYKRKITERFGLFAKQTTDIQNKYNQKIEQLKQQHRDELESLKMKRWEYIPETAASPVPNLPGHGGNSQFFDNRDGYNAAVDKINEAITNLLEQKGSI